MHLIIFVLLFCRFVQGLRSSIDLQLSAHVFGQYASFGFLNNGFMNVSIVATDLHGFRGSVIGLVCSEDSFETLVAYESSGNSFCHPHDDFNLTSLCVGVGQVGYIGYNNTLTSSLIFEITLDQLSGGTFFYYALASCSNRHVELHIDYVFLNPNGEELSYGLILMKQVPVVFASLWFSFFLLIVLAAFLLFYKRRVFHSLERLVGRHRSSDVSIELRPLIASSSASTTATSSTFLLTNSYINSDNRTSNKWPLFPLHYVFMICQGMYILSNGLEFLYYHIMSETGVTNETFYFFANVMDITSSSCILTSLLLLSRGWTITRPTLSKFEWNQVVTLILTYQLVWISFALLDGYAFIFLLLVVNLIIIRYIYASTLFIVNALEMFQGFFLWRASNQDFSNSSVDEYTLRATSQSYNAEIGGPNQSFSYTRNQIKLLQKSRIIATAFLFLNTIDLLSLSDLHVSEFPWIPYSIKQSLSVLLMVYYLVMFIPREDVRDTLFYREEGYFQDMESIPIDLQEEDESKKEMLVLIGPGEGQDDASDNVAIAHLIEE
jgi:Rhodopsin-like GPCR transmembrane domain